MSGNFTGMTHPTPLRRTVPDGKFLRQHREVAGVTQAQVAARSGYSETYLSLIETGKKNPPPATLFRIADAIAECSRGAA